MDKSIGEASQNSELVAAEKAIDGIYNGNAHRGSCSSTAYDWDNWWGWTFPDEIYIESVEILNRNDCCTGRLYHRNISLLTSSGKHFCSNTNDFGGDQPQMRFYCETIKKSHGIRIEKAVPKQARLAICEVDIFMLVRKN